MRLTSKSMRDCLWVVCLGLTFFSVSASASPTAPQAGVEYVVLDTPQPVEAGKKIEVIEFFAYFCPHCNVFEPTIEKWVKQQGDRIVFKRVHVDFHQLVTMQKMYYALEAMGKADEYQSKVFHAFHVEGNHLQTDSDVALFVTKAGLDKKAFFDLYNSFSISTKVRLSSQLQEVYHIDSIPSVAIDGRFVTSPVTAATSLGRVSEEKQIAAVVQVMDFLVARAQKSRGVAAAAAAAPLKLAAPASKTKKK
jgi:thiol:disulfide interchange protein DsbA